MTLLPAQTTVNSIGEEGLNRWSGFLQIDLFYRRGIPTTKSNKLVDAIVNAYPQNVFLGDQENKKVNVLACWRDTAPQSTHYMRVPVFVSFESYLPR